MPRLNAEDRDKVLALLNDGLKPSKVAAMFNVHKSSVTRLLCRVKSTGTTADRPRPGRPFVTNSRAEHRIVQLHLKNKTLPAYKTAKSTIGAHGKEISPATVRRILRKHNVGNRTRIFSKGPSKVAAELNLTDTPVTSGAIGEGQAVYLTPYIKCGLIHEAQNASTVSIPNMVGEHDLNSWSGYLSVGQNSSYHLFFWYFLCNGVMDNTSTPLLIWLNGGPGYSSMVGLFEEIGPLKADAYGNVTIRDGAWTEHFDMLFIDNPMNTGFSNSDDDKPTVSVKEAAEHLYEFIDQFYQLFPDAQSRDLYIGGQSYGGKYVPEVAALVRNNVSINLKGIFVGSGLLDPGLMLPLTPDYLEAVGMLNLNETEEMRGTIEHAMEKHDSNPQEAVMDIMDCVFGTLKKVMGHDKTENILYSKDNHHWTLEHYLNQPHVQEALHARPTRFQSFNEKVIEGMAEDFLQGVQDSLTFLLHLGVKVLIYNGQLDPAVSPRMTEKFLSNLSWSGMEEYKAGGGKDVWRDGTGAVAGYVSSVSNFTRVVIRNAGHRTAVDQPLWVLDMMKRFVHNRPFKEVEQEEANNFSTW